MTPTMNQNTSSGKTGASARPNDKDENLKATPATDDAAEDTGKEDEESPELEEDSESEADDSEDDDEEGDDEDEEEGDTDTETSDRGQASPKSSGSPDTAGRT